MPIYIDNDVKTIISYNGDIRCQALVTTREIITMAFL